MDPGRRRAAEPELAEGEVRIERADRLPSLGTDGDEPGWHRLTDSRDGPSDPRVLGRNASLRRHGVVLLAALLGILLAATVRDLPDPDRDVDAAVVAALDGAARAVMAGRIELTTSPRAVADGVSAALVGADGATPMLVAPGSQGCYALVATRVGTMIGQHFSDAWRCEPSSGLAAAMNRGGEVGPTVAVEDPYPWDLPGEPPWRSWYLLTTMLLAMVAVGVSARIAIVLVTGRPFGEELDLY